MKKTFLMPKMMLLAIFFLASIFTRVNAQIIIGDVTGTTINSSDTIKTIKSDTLIISSPKDVQLASVKIYDISNPNILILKKYINYNDWDAINKNISTLKTTKGTKLPSVNKNTANIPSNGNPTEHLPFKVLAKIPIKDLPCGDKKYLISITYLDVDRKVVTMQVIFARCKSDGYTEPNKNPIKN
jgi:hypothetical protein